MWAPVTSSALLIAGMAAPLPGGYASPVDIREGPLDAALRELARQTGAELLFDRTALHGLEVRRLTGRMTVEAALRALLRDSHFTPRHAASGAWLVERRPSEELAEPEILVVARRTQNIDIRRRENDIQPYRVAERGHRYRAGTVRVE